VRRADDVVIPNSGLCRAAPRRTRPNRPRATCADQSCLQIGLDHQPAAGAVDDSNAPLAAGEEFRIDQIARLGSQWCVQRDEIRTRQQIQQIDFLDAQFGARSASGRVGGITFILRPSARSATIDPIFPQPMIERLAVTSTP